MVGIVALEVLAACLTTVQAPSKEALPNIVMIIGDDQGWTDYGFMGSKAVRTPNLDKLAMESLVFERGYLPSSLCRPSLATMVTGLFPHQHGVTSNDPPYPPGVRPAERMKNEKYLSDRAAMVRTFERSPNLATLLSQRGYVSHQSGKWWEGSSCRCGFTAGMTHGDPTKGGRHGDEGLHIGRKGLQPVFEFLDKARADGKPFYLWYAPMMPHTPHNPPQRLLKKYAPQTDSIHVARYWAMCEWFDETVGALLAKLDQNGQAANTVVVYLHDNGWIQDPSSPAYAPRSKQSRYDGGLRTPIVIRWPGKVKPARTSALASSIDLAPTLLQAAGLKPTPAMTGLNLLDQAAVGKRDAVFGEVFLHTAVDLEKPGKNLRFRWVVRDRWKLIVPNPSVEPTQRHELFDLSSDPNEFQNLADAHPVKVAELSKRIDAWWDPSKDEASVQSSPSDPEALLPKIRAEVQPEIDRGLGPAQRETFQELAIADTITAHFKTSLWQRAVKDPWGALSETERRGLRLSAASRKGLGALPEIVEGLGAFLDKPPGAAQPLKTPGTLEDHLLHIEAVLDAAAALRGEALTKLAEAERAFLFNRSAGLIHEFRPQASFSERNKPILRDDRAFCTAWERTVDGPKFAASVRTLLQLTDPAYLDALRTAMTGAPSLAANVPSGVTGEVLAVKETRHGLIVLGGKGRNSYDFKRPAAFLADLGGDDSYKGVIASSADSKHPFGVVCDFAGDDAYEPAEMGLATGRLGVGILIDRGGNDTYKLAPGSGGCGFAGVGLLVDESGKDVYHGTRFAQGAAVAGLGLLLDLSGDDAYSAHGYALGIGGPAGVGAVIDVAGDDQYRCGFHYGSGYNQSDAPTAKPGDPNYQYDAFGLGIGIGRRTYPPTAESSEYHLAGGVGVWLDLAGNDRSESSNFTQACAYFFGTGLKLDLAGDDRHAAARYGLAAGAHYGLGLFLDYDGRDVYDCVGPTYDAGCAWDRSVFLLADGRGDDVYDWTRSSGGGRGDRGGWGVLADLAGDDKYRTAGPLGSAAAKALGTFFDGGGTDEYPKANASGVPANRVVKPDGAGGLFIDR